MWGVVLPHAQEPPPLYHEERLLDAAGWFAPGDAMSKEAFLHDVEATGLV